MTERLKSVFIDPPEPDHECDMPGCHQPAVTFIVPIQSYSCNVHALAYP